MKLKNKKGDVALINVIMFLVLNLVFVSVMFVFVDYAGSRALIYEQSYAKQIALIIDNAKPEMVVLLDVERAIKFAKENNQELKNVFRLDNEKNKITVHLTKQGGYGYIYFSDYDVELKLNGNYLSIIVKEK